MATDIPQKTRPANEIREIKACILRSTVRRPPYFLTEDVAHATVKMALQLTHSGKSNGFDLRRLARAATEYVMERGRRYMKFLCYQQDQRASEYLREAHNAIAFCLRNLGEPEPVWAARSIDLVGYYLCFMPKFYGCDLLDRLITHSDENVLNWAHLYQLARLAEVGPPVLEHPQLKSWLAKNEGSNAPIYARYLSRIQENKKIWADMAQGIADLADDAIDEQLSPLQLERKVNLLLQRTPRGRPPKRTIDYSSPINLPDIPLR